MKEKLLKNKKLVVILLGIIVIVTVYSYNNIYIPNKRTRIFNQIQSLTTAKITMEDLAKDYKCSVDDLTIKKLKEILKDYQKYRKEQNQYTSKYQEKLSQTKRLCIENIKADIIDIEFTGIWNENVVSITPKKIDKINFTFILIDPKNEELLRAGMLITYSGTGMAMSKKKVNEFSAVGIVGVEFDLKTNEAEYFCKSGESTYNSQYLISIGSNINWGERYGKYPYALNTSNNEYDYFLFVNMDKEPIEAKEQKEKVQNKEENEVNNIESYNEDNANEQNSPIFGGNSRATDTIIMDEDEQSNNTENEKGILFKTYNTTKKEGNYEYHVIKIYKFSNGTYTYEKYWCTYGDLGKPRTCPYIFETIEETLTSVVNSFSGIEITAEDLEEE